MPASVTLLKTPSRPSAKVGRVPAPSRRTQAERSAATRAKLMEAAVLCLRRTGYSATTTTQVAAHAGVSRGAMLHQFPTKVDLMLAVVEHVFRHQQALSARLLRKTPPGAERFMALTEITWRVQSQAASMAMLEILVAARSDRILAKRLKPLAEGIDREVLEGAWSAAVEAGITDRALIEQMVHLHLAAMRGLSVELMYGRRVEETHKAVELLKVYKAFLMRELAPIRVG